jgi:rSAM/selenodomain-associated transferase 2
MEVGHNREKPSPPGDFDKNVQKTISIVIPVLHEVAPLRQTLGQFARLSPDESPHEIIVVDGDRNGSTIGSINMAGIVTATSPPGRAIQMNRGAALASGEILLFLHADTLLPAGGLSEISAATGDTPTAWGAFDLGIDSNRPIFRLIEAAIRLRTRITRIPYGDQALFLTRPLFESVGGFPEIPIMEDVELARKLHRLKAVMRILPEKVRTSPRRWETEGLAYCTLRNWLLITALYLGVSPDTLSKYYRSQHLLKRRRG